MAKDYVLEKRKYVIGGVALAIVLIYLLRLFSLQIATDDYKKNADSNAFLNKIQYPLVGQCVKIYHVVSNHTLPAQILYSRRPSLQPGLLP